MKKISGCDISLSLVELEELHQLGGRRLSGASRRNGQRPIMKGIEGLEEQKGAKKDKNP